MKGAALHAYITPVRMKKGRPGVTLTALSNIDLTKEKIARTMFNETPPRHLWSREKSLKEKCSRSGQDEGCVVKAKLVLLDGKIVNLAPEYSDCIKLSKKATDSFKIE